MRGRLDRSLVPGRAAGPFYGWRLGWELPALVTRTGGGTSALRAVEIDTTPPGGPLADVPEPEVARRLREGHRLYQLRVGGELAAYGWAATGPAHIGGLDLFFTVPPGEHYLWDFMTLPAFRGRGLYPLLLQEIVRRELDEVEWFWIGHESRNEASRRGILKAGFKLAGYLWRLPDGELAFVGAQEAGPETARRAARTLGLRLAAGA